MSTPPRLDSSTLAHLLRELVLAQDFGACGPPFPSLDLAVVAFPRGAPPASANVLFSRDHPRGLIAAHDGIAGPVANVGYLADAVDADGECIAWDARTDWNRMDWKPLRAASGADRFVAPYPASLVKLMFAVGVALGVERGLCAWDEFHTHDGRRRKVAAWCERMITVSCNDATNAIVALLHARGLLDTAGGALQRLFDGWGLDTLRVADTKAYGGWRIADGCGVGHLQMTAWDSARLLWLLDEEAPPAPWAHGPVLGQDSRAVLRAMLARQGLHFVLSSTAVAGMPGHVTGIPARMPAHWLADDGGARVPPYRFPPGAAAASGAATVSFDHKTGTTDNYLSDAGIVRAPGAGRHYIVALTSSLGRRHAPHPLCATTWKIPALGGALDRTLIPWLESH